MVDVAKVTMFGENVGTFRWDNTYDVARFEYDAQFVGKGVEPSPLMMPVQQGRIYSFGNLNREVFNPNRSLGFLCVVRQREILMTDLGLYSNDRFGIKERKVSKDLHLIYLRL